MKTLAFLLLCCASTYAQQNEYLTIYQVTVGPANRREIKFDFGSKYDSAKTYAVQSKSLVDALELAERKGWEYVTTYVETIDLPDFISFSNGKTTGSITNILMRRRR